MKERTRERGRERERAKVGKMEAAGNEKRPEYLIKTG
jgi:hypothetical protein